LNRYRAVGAIALTFAATFLFVSVRPSQAMPPFAQAYGMNCEVCHTAVPALNAYGRYVQRTGYASLDPATIHRANPIWLGETLFYDSQDAAMPHKIQTGNLAIHAAGYIGKDWTFHGHQWITQANQSGGTDTLWLTYNNLFHRDGHLFVGKILDAVPSPYSQWSELSGFATLSVASGEHAWQFGANRWGAKFSYTHICRPRREPQQRNRLLEHDGQVVGLAGCMGTADHSLRVRCIRQPRSVADL
jgi:hypothetical protein